MNPLTFSILRCINDGKFHSGVSLAKQIGFSRPGISSALQDIEKYGPIVQKIRGRGYRWCNPFRWLDKKIILDYTVQSSESFHLILLDSTASTNSYLLNSARSSLYPSSRVPVIATELQIRGRGRQGRQWHSGLGDSLTFSLQWRFEQGASSLSGLSLIIGVAIIRVLNSFSIKGAVLKWPNDILYCSRKLAGVLIELHGEMLGPTFAVIGIGLNIKLSANIKHSIREDVADIFDIMGRYIDRNILLAALLLELKVVLVDFGLFGFAYFKHEWVSYHAYEGKAVSIILPDGSVKKGIADGVNNDGSLILKTSMGRSYFNVGEITLRTG